MRPPLINRSPDLSRLAEEGYEVADEVKREFWYHCLNILINQFNNVNKEVVLPTESIDLKLGEDDPFSPIVQLITKGSI